MRLLGSYVNTTTKSVAIRPTFPGPGARIKPLDGIRVPQKPPGVELILKLVRHGPASTALPGKGKAAWFTGLTITYDQGGEYQDADIRPQTHRLDEAPLGRERQQVIAVGAGFGRRAV